ncbi:dnaJ homolog subfamily C member 14-like [Diaphorina citri]|uniref:DnaJ homolog subfamily C member 14-like n=1 Tax=Diaphorina citri TaxID=121845 RepID=A0A3Q0INU7_DIACI|nr:dnaJ homolog subfamily C member 14-like [Diaphorina citri]
METSVYDITEWAACQAVNLKHLKANSHSVQYRIVVGKQHPPPASSASPSHHSHHPHCPNGSSDPDIEDFLNTLYQSSSGGAGGSTLCSEHSLHQHSHLHHSHTRPRRKGGKKKK